MYINKTKALAGVALLCGFSVLLQMLGTFISVNTLFFYGVGSISHRFFHSSVWTALWRNAAGGMYVIGCYAEPGQISLDPVYLPGDLHFPQRADIL